MEGADRKMMWAQRQRWAAQLLVDGRTVATHLAEMGEYAVLS